MDVWIQNSDILSNIFPPRSLSCSCVQTELWHSGLRTVCWPDIYFEGSKFTFQMGIIQQKSVVNCCVREGVLAFSMVKLRSAMAALCTAHVDTNHLQSCSAHFFLCSSQKSAPCCAVRAGFRNGHFLIPYSCNNKGLIPSHFYY